MIKNSVAKEIGAPISKTKQTALQADGLTRLAVVGEVHLTVTRNSHQLQLEALVVDDLDVDLLAGTPFMIKNDISVRPSRQEITIDGSDIIHYGPQSPEKPDTHIRRTQAQVIRGPPSATVIWPGEYLELDTPPGIDPESTLAIEPRPDCCRTSLSWPDPYLIDAVAGKVRIVNNTKEPKQVGRHEHFRQVSHTVTQSSTDKCPISPPSIAPPPPVAPQSAHSSTVKVDPDKILPEDTRSRFHDLISAYEEVFSPDISGYNGAEGPFEAVVNIGPAQPPQRKGRLPQYSRNKLVTLQEKFDELERQGVFRRPEDVGITAEYLNPSFLVTKPTGGHRLVTAFSDVARYSKPQPSLMPDVDSTLRSIAKWKYIIVADLTSAFYQIPLSKQSMKYCGVATPYRGVRVYTRCAMGMPGSETALEELMCRVLGDCLQDGIVAKLADDLYCGADSPEDLFSNWQRVLAALLKSNLHLSPSKTVISPRSTTILGWIWTNGYLSASPHRIATLSSCPPPTTVRGLRSFLGAYKVLGRVLPHCSHVLAPLENAISGRESNEHIEWTESLRDHFQAAQTSLSTHKAIALPRPTDQMWIVTDGSVSKRGIGSTLYVSRDRQLHLAGFFSAKLRKHQVSWLPCEIESLSIAASIKHFSPFIIQSTQQVCLLTDSKPCVQAIEKLCRGEFSASPRVTSFLSIVSRYQVHVRHLAGSSNIPSDFASRNAPECNEPRCQVCNFITLTEDSVVRTASVKDIQESTRLPFTTRSAWFHIQAECSDLRRTHAHLKQGTRPSKKLTNIKDVKRYLNVATIAKDGLLVVRRTNPLSPSSDLIIVPRSVLDGLVTALHIKLDHPSKHQLEMVMKRHFYALDLSTAIEHASKTCHTCASLRKLPEPLVKHSTQSPPEVVGVSFAADVLVRNKQSILVVRETSTSFTKASIIPDEKSVTLREYLISLCLDLHPPDGPPATIRVDPGPGFQALKQDETLKKLGLTLEIGRTKNPNKNPVAEKAIAELEEELLRQAPNGGPINHVTLSLSVSRLNSRLRREGVSAHELWTQRSQFTQEQLPFSDRDTINRQHNCRLQNHPFSERSKNKTSCAAPQHNTRVGDLVYLSSDKDKTQARPRYLVTSIDKPWCSIQKFTGKQLRARPYKVKLHECYLVPNQISSPTRPSHIDDTDSDSEQEDVHPNTTVPLPAPNDIPPELVISDGLNTTKADQDTTQAGTTSGRPNRSRPRPSYFEFERW